jgi:uncharacterized protein YndB with AHSA1/START domain
MNWQREEGATMTTHTADLAAVVGRLEKVERENRRLKFVGAAVLVVAAAGLVMGQAWPTSRTVEAEAFVLRDASGPARAAWHPSPGGGAALTFFDQAGNGRAMLRADRDGSPHLTLTDQAAQTRAVLRVEGNGSPGLVLFDQGGKMRATLYVVSDGSATLQLSDKAERVFWRVP